MRRAVILQKALLLSKPAAKKNAIAFAEENINEFNFNIYSRDDEEVDDADKIKWEGEPDFTA